MAIGAGALATRPQAWGSPPGFEFPSIARMANEPDDRVRAVLAGILKRAGKGTAQLLSEGSDSDVDEVIPSGIDVLDHHVIGIGGWPLGRIVELFASEGDGKTSVLFQAIAGVQRE